MQMSLRDLAAGAGPMAPLTFARFLELAVQQRQGIKGAASSRGTDRDGPEQNAE